MERRYFSQIAAFLLIVKPGNWDFRGKIETEKILTNCYFCEVMNGIIKYFLLFFSVLLICISLPAQNKKIKPKGVKQKAPKIRFKKYKGKALLKTGLKMEGQFKYKNPKNGVPYFLVKESKYPGKKKIDITMFDQITLAGAERGVVDRKDSTMFKWLDGFDDLYRQVRRGDIEVYDNSRVIAEKYKFIPGYVMVGHRKDYATEIVSELSDLQQLMKDRPYFLESAKATGKYESRDLRVIIYLIDLFNDSNPMKNLKWQPVEVVQESGGIMEGFGYIQPVDLRNEFTKSSDAYLHFYDGKQFQLLTQDEVKWIYQGGNKYVPGFYSMTDKHAFGIPWEYEGKQYLVSKKLSNTKSYFFVSRYTSGEDLVILEEFHGSFKRAGNEPLLKAKYLMQEKDKKKK